MTTPNTPTAQQVDPEVLKLQIAAFDAQLTALDSQRDSTLAQNAVNYARQKSLLNRQKTAVQEQIAQLTPPPATTPAPTS